MAASVLEEDSHVLGLGSSFSYCYVFCVFPLSLSVPSSMGAPVMVELEGETDPLKIAMKELKYIRHTSDIIFT